MRTLFVLVAVLAACSKGSPEDYTKNAPPQDPTPETKAPPPPPPKAKKLTEADLGTCHITASGAVTADQTTPGGRAATNVSYWLGEAERKNMMGIDGFVVNCIGKDVRFSIVPGGGSKDAMPFKPKTFTFDKGKADANVMAVFGKQSLSLPSGTIDITAFDTHHIAGTIDIKGKLAPGNGDVKIDGKFDLTCPGFSGCDK
jgi:hypothetical protein